MSGVLVEKAKTTPDQYPLTVNSLVNGCNQKNNRDPNMQLEEADVMESLDRLKSFGAVTEIQGSGAWRSFAICSTTGWEWIKWNWRSWPNCSSAAQTEGELRGRAARMEPIADLTTLRAIVQSLRAKGLVIEMTPPGRGQIISHALYEPQELERLKERHAGAAGAEELEGTNADPSAEHRQPAHLPRAAASSNAGVAASVGVDA